MNENFFFGCETCQDVYCLFVGAVQMVVKSYESGEYTKVKAFDRIQELCKDKVAWLQLLDDVGGPGSV